MVFNSIPFAIFFPVVFILYWLIGHKRVKGQNLFLLGASYFFYGWWDWRFLSLLIFSSAVGYLSGWLIHKTTREKRRKAVMYLSVIVSLSFLLFFKYYNFFVENFIEAFSLFGKSLNITTLQLILPLGISFYTFRIVGYILDVYKRKIEAEKDIVSFFVFVSYFPQLVAGPIERATTLLPQLKKQRKFNYDQASEGAKLILWGLFKKVVIADTCAIYVSDIFNNYDNYPSSVLLLGTIYFAYQVYADFSGYSDIALGIAKLMGFELMVNFNDPFVSKNITEFWRRWHISLSSWFNDYIFTPVYTALRNWGNAGMFFGIFITFFLSGLWHGASWHYVFFGVIHGLAIIFETYTKKRRKKVASRIPGLVYNNISIALTFSFLLITWIFFRAENMSHAWNYLTGIFTPSILEIPGKLAYLPLVALLVIWEWIQRGKPHGLYMPRVPVILRWGIYIALTFLILYYYGEEQQFYYFQF